MYTYWKRKLYTYWGSWLWESRYLKNYLGFWHQQSPWPWQHFDNSLNSEIFPENWKRPNIVPVHKKGNKQQIQNYRTLSLLPISSNILERLTFNSLYKFVEENSLFCSSQSGFRKTDSCFNQPLSIVHEIYKSCLCWRVPIF